MAISKQSKIRWNRSDYITLGKAVAQFNKKIRELTNEENKLYLPKETSYKVEKENIMTRKQLNIVLKNLKDFQEANSTELVIIDSGSKMTKWEYNILTRERGVAIQRLQTRLKELNKPLSTGFSRVQMGSSEVRKIEQIIQSLNKLEQKSGYELEQAKRVIRKYGSSDYTLKMSYVYQENFMSELKTLANNIPAFQKVYDYFNNIKNPITFFNITQQTTILQDFFRWYENPNSYGAFKTDEEVAEYIIEQYKIEEG